jgi:hypothetical protein
VGKGWRSLIAPSLKQHVDDVAVSVDGSPKIGGSVLEVEDHVTDKPVVREASLFSF